MKAAVCCEFGQPLIIEDVTSTRLSVDVPRLFDLYRNKQLLLDQLISGRIPLDQINEAIAHTHTGAAIRNVIVF